MGQQPFSIRCGSPAPVALNCPPNGSNDFDKDGAGVAIQYGITQPVSPCKSPVVVTTHPPIFGGDGSTGFNGAVWDPGARPNIPGFPLPDAAHPPIVNPGAFPLPPHAWGWEGADDFLTITTYDFTGTIAEVAATSNLFPHINSVQITIDYDVTMVNRFSERKVTYTRPDFLHAFDFSSAASDTWDDLENTTTTTHVTNVVSVTGSTNPANGWGSIDLAGYAPFTAQWQSSGYFNKALSNGQNPGPWGSFAEFRPDGLTLVVVYQFGRQTRTVSNVQLTISAIWVQYHCTPDTGGTPPCKCNKDCPPCQGTNPPVKSGRCTTLCADGGTSPTLQQGWTITKPSGESVADSANPGGWSVGRNSDCTLTICAPCYHQGDYLGPFVLTWGTSNTCNCPGQQTQYKTFGVQFSVQVDVVCPEPPPPDPKIGRSISYDVAEDGRHARAYIANQTPGSSGRVVVGVAQNVFPLQWNDRNSSVNAIDASLSWDKMSRGSTLYLLIQSGSSIVLMSSFDEGKTFSLVQTLGNGSHPSLKCARDGRKLCYWYGNGAIVGAFVDSAGNIEEDVFTAIPKADDDDLSHDESVDKSMTWRVTLIYRDGGQIKTKSSTDGKIFT